MTAHVARPEMIHVRVQIDAITGEWVDVTCPLGSSIAEIIAAIPLSPLHEPRRALLQAYIGEYRIPRDRWPFVRPFSRSRSTSSPVTLVLRLPVHGGGRGGSKALSIVAAIALISLTAFIGGGALAGVLGPMFGQGALGARLLATGVSIAGSLALQGLMQPEDKSESKEPISTAGAPNDFEPGAPLQRVIGRMMVTPQLVVPPFTTMFAGVRKSGGTVRYDQTVTAVYALAGRHEIEQVYIGSVEASTVPDLEVEIREGLDTDAPLTFVTDTRIEEQLNLNLSEWETDPDDEEGPTELIGTVAESEPDWHRVEARADCDGFTMQYVLPSGLIYRPPSGNIYSPGVSLRHRIRRRGLTGWGGWINIPELMIRAQDGNNAIRLEFEIRWVDSLPSIAGNAWPPNAKGFARVRGWAQVWSHDDWPSSALVTRVGTGYAQWRYESDKRVILYLLKSKYPKGRYQVEVKRSWPLIWEHYTPATHKHDYEITTGDFFGDTLAPDHAGGNRRLPYNSNCMADDITLVMVQSRFAIAPIADDGEPTTLIAVRARNRNIDKVRVLATGVCPDWTGSAWVMRANRNPASWYRHVLRDRHNAQPVPDALIDTSSLADWAEWCSARGFHVDMIAKGKSVDEVLRAIALAGWASPAYGARHSVVVERARPYPVGIVSQRNAGRFSMRKAFGDLPHGLRLPFVDADDDWTPREVVVYAPGYGPTSRGGRTEATLFETVSYEGLTSEAAVRARAQLDYRWRIWRSTMYSCEMDFEHLEFQRGDLVLWETDILGAVTGRGRVEALARNASGAITALTVDEEQGSFTGGDADLWDVEDLWEVGDLWSVGRFGVAIRCADGDVIIAEMVNGTSPDTLQFVEPLPMPTFPSGREAISEGSLVTCGPLGRVSREVLIWSIDRSRGGRDLTAMITAVDYAPAPFYGYGAS